MSARIVLSYSCTVSSADVNVLSYEFKVLDVMSYP